MCVPTWYLRRREGIGIYTPTCSHIVINYHMFQKFKLIRNCESSHSIIIVTIYFLCTFNHFQGPYCTFWQLILKSQLILLFSLFLLLFISSTTLFGTVHGSHHIISANFYFYLQYFQQNKQISNTPKKKKKLIIMTLNYTVIIQ